MGSRRRRDITVVRFGTGPVPDHDPPVIANIDSVALDKAVNGWVRARASERAKGGTRVVAVDGKEARGAKNGGGKRVFLMAALDHATGTVVGQESIGEKTNEIPHFTGLMDKIGELEGVVITADALHTQRDHADYLHKHGAHYVLTVKNNQRAGESESVPKHGPPSPFSTSAGRRSTGGPRRGRPRLRPRKNGSVSPTRNRRCA